MTVEVFEAEVRRTFCLCGAREQDEKKRCMETGGFKHGKLHGG